MTTMQRSSRHPSQVDSRFDEGTCCSWCGLPVAATVSSRAAVKPGPEAVYCCFGCRLAHEITEERGQEGAIRWTMVRLGIAIFFSMNLMAFTMTMWSVDIYDVERTEFQRHLYEVFRWLSMIFSMPVLLLLGVPLLQNAVRNWRQGSFSTDLLIVSGVTAAYVISVVSVLQGQETVYFEVGAAVLVMVTLGRWLEATGRQKATEALDQLAALLPMTARRIDVGGEETQTDCSSLQVGDLIRVLPGERFPVDAVVVTGESSVDEQVFSGESVPVSRVPGDRLCGGTVNLDGVLAVEVTAPFREGSFGRLLNLIREARLSRGPWQQLTDRVSRWFFPVVTVVASITFLFHLSSGAGTAVQNSLSVLLIACPCALGLATPLAVWTALSTAIRHQVLFRSGEAIERLASVDSVCFDKTGTLTTGMPQVHRICILEEHDLQELLRLSAVLARTSTHPFSRAVLKYAELSSADPAVQNHPESLLQGASLRTVKSISGGGVEATLGNGTVVRLGSPDFVQAGQEVPHRLRLRIAHAMNTADQEASSVVSVSINGRPVIMYLLSETIRPEASSAVRECMEMELPVTILTGDRAAKAEQLQRSLLDCHEAGCRCSAECASASAMHRSAESANTSDAFPTDHAIAAQPGEPNAEWLVPPPAHAPRLRVLCDLKPEGKVHELRMLRDRGLRVAMVGDGINDAPALAVSDIGIAMGCGADVSRDSAQVCLLTNNLSRIPWAFRLARDTRRVIRQNLFWAFGYNGGGVLLASAGLLNPAVAAGLMIVSSLLVISNSLRLMSCQPPDTSAEDRTEQTPGRSVSMNTSETITVS